MLYFCTLFDSHYLTRGLAMFQSLRAHCPAFHLYIFAFDETCLRILSQQQLEFVTIIALQAFENAELLAVKRERSIAEYCWTCTPAVIDYAIRTYDLPHCTYLDADLYFWNSPERLIHEMAQKSVLITAHRYSSPHQHLEKVLGTYCVQFVTFKNDENGRKVLNWWKQSCLEWCYARLENGKYGDQKYLDDWPSRFVGIHELQHLGGGIAPWNVQQYRFSEQEGKIWGTVISTGQLFPVVFFHFHNMRYLNRETLELAGGYRLTSNHLETFYRPYVKHLHQLYQELVKLHGEGNYQGIFPMKKTWKIPLQTIKRYFWGTRNIYPLRPFLGIED
ncbi:glycosyl transferase [Deltaproteobacteria bacterium TL4]